jgi:hypothetical protein
MPSLQRRSDTVLDQLVIPVEVDIRTVEESFAMTRHRSESTSQ